MGSRFDSFPYRDLLRQVLDSDYRRKCRMAGRHIAIDTWLEALNMTDYLPFFHQYGGVEDLLYTTEAEIKDLGIKNGGHRAKIVSSLRILRDKYEKGRVTGSGVFSLQRSQSNISISAPNSPTSPYPEFQHVIASPEKLQADLQKELAGDPFELRSRPWYHGNISRQHAESLVTNNGDFLVRDCISKPGDFVLTSKWKGTPLNFMINSIVNECLPGSLPTISYQFEEESYPTIQQLILSYKQRGKAVTLVSGAVLTTPVARCMPLSYYDTKYGALNSSVSGLSGTPSNSPKPSPFATPTGSPEMNRRKVPWTGSQPILNIIHNLEDTNNNNNFTHRKRESRSSSLDRYDSLPIINITPPGGFPAPEPVVHPGRLTPRPTIAHIRAGSAPALTPDNSTSGTKGATNIPKFGTIGRRKLANASSESELSTPPPPKPSRIPSIKYRQKPTVIVRNIRVDDDDRDYSDYTQVQEEPSWLRGNSNSVPKFQEGTPKRLSPSPVPAAAKPQTGRRAQRVNREKIFSPSSSDTQNLSDSTRTRTSTSPARFPNQQNVRPNINSRVSPVPVFGPFGSDEPPSSPTYQIVARSRSFQSSKSSDDDYDNNVDNISDRGYMTLPNRPRAKTHRVRLPSDVHMPAGDSDQEHDYDTPRDHEDDDDVIRFPDLEFMRSRKITKPLNVYHSAILPETFTSDLLPKGHKALDQSVLLNAKAILINKSPKAIALHLTRYDLELLNVTTETDVGLGVTSGLEFMTLPQGKQLRQDAMERWECLRLFAMVTLLTSQTVNERAKLLSLWIQTCSELKTCCGNLYSFSAIMAALTGHQFIRLTDTWLILRQNYTASAYLFDTKLRPAFKSLNDGSSDLPLNNICVPYVTPVCQLLERNVESILQDYYWEKGLDPIGAAIDVLFTHLDTARVIASQGNLYSVTGKAILSTLKPDRELTQSLRPEFHLLLLWGEKGWAAKRGERLEKLEQIFTLLSQKYQVPGDDGTQV